MNIAIIGTGTTPINIISESIISMPLVISLFDFFKLCLLIYETSTCLI